MLVLMDGTTDDFSAKARVEAAGGARSCELLDTELSTVVAKLAGDHATVKTFTYKA